MATQTALIGINPDCLYPIAALKKLCGWGTLKLREARKRGLKVIYEGRSGFVRGSAIIDYIESHGDERRAGAQYQHGLDQIAGIEGIENDI